MKRILLLIVVMIMIPLMVGCNDDPTENYLSQMTALTETEAIEVWVGFDKSTYYVSHKRVLNPEETLYYAPKKIKNGEDIYLNEQELFFILTVHPGIITTTTTKKATAEELELIFN